MMNGLVLWFNPEARVGMIWCEDQGPLAFLGPEVLLPEGCDALACGDLVSFSIELRDDVRFVQEISAVTAGMPGCDPREIIMGYQRRRDDDDGHLSVVA